MDDIFGAPLRQENLHQRVAARIQALVISNSIHPGDKLPSERELADRLGVSRVVIREATRVLKTQGLVDVKPGSGTFVKEIGPDSAIESLWLFLKMRRGPSAFQDLLEIRELLEIEIAGRAAERATPEDHLAMEATIEDMERTGSDMETFTKHDLAFHMALAKATQNELYNVLLTPVRDLLLEFRHASYTFDPKRAVEGGIQHHRDILECVKIQDVVGARNAMSEHLRQARDTLEKLELLDRREAEELLQRKAT